MTMPTKVDANPTKAFFVRMITRDISLEDCILDLIDNSVDGAWRLEGGRQMTLAGGADLSNYIVKITASADEFSIQDNCGGMTLDIAAEYAFTFGRKGNSHENFSIGVYGIGMKRAIFKIGSSISIRSTYQSNASTFESFRVPIEVNNWVNEESRNWDFDIEPAENLESPGVEISIKNLHEETSVSLGSPLFLQDLKRTISRDYAMHLHRGLQIQLNGEKINGWQIAMLESDAFAPMRIEYADETESGLVKIEILAGMAAPPPESSEPSDDDRKDDRFGWYVVCNGRIVLAADKTTLSGWGGGEDWPSWHPQYAGFIGIIMFTSENAILLPLTTTKRSVDVASPVYRRARPRMREASKQWISYTNSRKQSLEQAKILEQATKPTSIFAIPIRATVSVPPLVSKSSEKPANIAYSIPVARVRQLAKSLGNINMTYRELGIQSFEYTYANNVSEDK